MSEFVHLHVHSQYSMLDGAITLKNLVKSASSLNMRAISLTDHGTMFGAISFYKLAKEAGVAPILGCELEVLSPRENAKNTQLTPLHLPLLAASEEGYKNLIWHVSKSQIESAYDHAQCIHLDSMLPRTKGLIALTGCMGGVLAQCILEEGQSSGEKTLAHLKDMFEPGCLYVELQDHGLPEQKVLNGILVELAKKFDLPLVATNDVHYTTREDSDAHLYLSCIRTGRSHKTAKEEHHGSKEMFLKSQEEMAFLFRHYPQAVRNTLEISERTRFELELNKPMLPEFHVPKGFSADTYFKHIAEEGLKERFKELSRADKKVDELIYFQRLQMEMDVICQMKFAGYFLIVWDFIRYAKENAIPVGPGRGSGAGSIVAYAMHITDLDPIPYQLLFERFLNPERVSMPDFDIDFCMDKRDQVIRYVQQKYGEESVGQIATFAELKAKSVLKDVARVIDFTPSESQLLANLIPYKTPVETYTIAEALEVEPKLKAKYETEPRVRELLTHAQKLEGLTRHAGKHAAGIVISEGPLWNHVPVFRDDKTGSYVTQYDKDDVEQAGLVKFDFLGLKTLTVIDISVRLINQRPDFSAHPEKKFDIANIPLNDKATYQLLASGETKGVFQLESSGMQNLFKNLKPDVFEDIIAAVALYRPGPLQTGMVDDFVACKHGRKPIAKMHALVDALLEPTYGVIVYQEQVMQIAQMLAGYTLGGADLLRRAMGKKKPEEMAKQKFTFVNGARNKGVKAEKAEEIFDLVEKFAGYGFNKSHSAAYALITYQTAYLKAHFPVEFLCGILSSDKDHIEKVVRTVADAKVMEIPVLPPDVNESDLDFSVIYSNSKTEHQEKKGHSLAGRPQIRFGLGAVRGLGKAALESLFEARKAGGPFADMFDFAARVDAKKINKAVFESLVQCGAFDLSLKKQRISRATAFASIEVALERSRSASRDRERGQTNLFGLFDSSSKAASQTNPSPKKVQNALYQNDYIYVENWDHRELLAREKQSLGFYVSGHPLLRYVRGEKPLRRLGVQDVVSCHHENDWALVKLAGMVEGYREKVFKDGSGKTAFFDLEDLSGRILVKMRGKAIDQFAPILDRKDPVLVTGKVSFPQRADEAYDESAEATREAILLLDDVTLLIDSLRQDASVLLIKIHANDVADSVIEKLREVLKKQPGTVAVHLRLELHDGVEVILSLGHRVLVCDALFSGIERLFGKQVVELK